MPGDDRWIATNRLIDNSRKGRLCILKLNFLHLDLSNYMTTMVI